jgi:hypothetical protein
MAARGRGGEEMRERDRRRGGGRRTAQPWRRCGWRLGTTGGRGVANMWGRSVSS